MAGLEFADAFIPADLPTDARADEDMLELLSECGRLPVRGRGRHARGVSGDHRRRASSSSWTWRR